MAEIRVAPQRRTRTIVLAAVVAIVILAALAWYFFAGPGVATTGGV